VQLSSVETFCDCSYDGCYDRACIDELLAAWIDAEVETLERPGAKQDHVAWLGKDHVIVRFGATRVNDRVPDVAIDRSPIGCSKPELLLPRDAEFFENCAWSPSQLGASVYESIRKFSQLTAL